MNCDLQTVIYQPPLGNRLLKSSTLNTEDLLNGGFLNQLINLFNLLITCIRSTYDLNTKELPPPSNRK